MGAVVSCPLSEEEDEKTVVQEDFSDFTSENRGSSKPTSKGSLSINPMRDMKDNSPCEWELPVPIDRKIIENDKKLLRKINTNNKIVFEGKDMKRENVVETKRRLSLQWQNSIRYNEVRNGGSGGPSQDPSHGSRGSGSKIPPGPQPTLMKPTLLRKLSSRLSGVKPTLERTPTMVASSIASYYEADRTSTATAADSPSELSTRLRDLRLRQEKMEDDGNCLFRSCSHHLYGHQRHHAVIREKVVRHMRSNPDMYSIYFECAEEWTDYIDMMSRNRTWGDELVLRAVTDAYGTAIHVVQSTDENWYLVYRPDGKKTDKQIFLTYLSPVHYNALVSVKWI
mmetsp:Transcript_25089/g.34575  ORF Transcript_25089/g.34575 Transcript_25089/m.34575 type:complete len:339 (-) Transcript_25089:57-1073(-)|eukprot:CAMPEP_0196600480 /NCGR_PEP_ID=MMETSP1081-20130531/95412_1 /TAXON_ID=36882 /ORGANISM="Pyramimonas amylifera, Strain CCMP720" /LENGTH=338 /DNA_ID=CAMNT_0041926319 /DNA_START=36 /DNA_END=1052 /DNA_ORIENTATION=-